MDERSAEVSTEWTIKRSQSYRYVDPRRQQQQHTVVAARVTSNRDGFRNRVTLTSDLLTSGSTHAERLNIEYTCTTFGVDSSSCFTFRMRTNRQTDKQTNATERPTHASGCTAHVVNKKLQLVLCFKSLIIMWGQFLANVNVLRYVCYMLWAVRLSSVCLSVCRCLSSVCRLRRWCTLLRRLNFSKNFFHHTIAQGLYFSGAKNRWWGTPLSPWNLRSKWPTPFKTAKFRQISAHSASTVIASEKSSISTYRKSTTRFPTSHRWTVYVTPKGGTKTRYRSLYQ